MGSVGVVVVDPAGDDDAGLGERVELLAVEELAAGASVGRFDEAVLPGRAWVDGEGLDAAQGEAVAYRLRDKLGVVVGAGPTKGSGRYSSTLTLKLPKAFAFSISHS